MATYLDRLPEDVCRLIYRKIFSDTVLSLLPVNLIGVHTRQHIIDLQEKEGPVIKRRKWMLFVRDVNLAFNEIISQITNQPMHGGHVQKYYVNRLGLILIRNQHFQAKPEYRHEFRQFVRRHISRINTANQELILDLERLLLA